MSTPQDIALKDAVKGISMFRKVDVRVWPSTFSPHTNILLIVYVPDPRHDSEYVRLHLSQLQS